MVVFTCNLCGDSLKKNKVDQHSRQCRFSSLSCVDCLKDFSLQTYASHFECITEDQKYGGLNYKQQEFKGKNKQNDWVQKIKTLTSENQFPKDIQYVLKSLVHYDNIPRKKPKFINFVKNSFRLRDEQLVNKIWDIFENSIKSNQNQNNCSSGSANEQKPVNSTSNGTKRSIEDAETNENGTKGEGFSEKKQKSETKADIEKAEQVTDVTSSETAEKVKMIKVVKSILSDHNEMSIKKLRKKVLKRYHKHGWTDESVINKKFDNIIKKDKFVVNDNLITLVQ